MNYIFCVLGGMWRAWFGGGMTLEPLLSCSRFFKYLALVGLCATGWWVKRGVPYDDWQFWVVVIAFGVHWALGHYPWYVIKPFDYDRTRDNWVTKIIIAMYGETGYNSIKGNVTAMAIRYTATAFLVAATMMNGWFLLAGPTAAVVYWFCYVLLPTGWYTKAAEFVTGGLTFLLFYECL